MKKRSILKIISTLFFGTGLPLAYAVVAATPVYAQTNKVSESWKNPDMRNELKEPKFMQSSESTSNIEVTTEPEEEKTESISQQTRERDRHMETLSGDRDGHDKSRHDDKMKSKDSSKRERNADNSHENN